MVATQHPADSRRDSSIQALLNSNVKSSVKDRAKRLSATCERLIKQSRPLTVPNVVQAFREMYAEDGIGESTIWNKTTSGAIYRGVVDAWSVWQMDKKRAMPSHQEIDAHISDSLLCRIEPPEARLPVLLMREALRNTKNQLNAVRSLTPDRLIRHGGAATSSMSPPAQSLLSKADLETMKSLLDGNELRLRGFYWDENGALIAEKVNASTGPGVLDVLKLALKCLEAARENK